MILLTGVCGYIGSHTAVELLEAGFDIVGVDNLCNSKYQVIDQIKKITCKSFKFYEGDILDKKLLHQIFYENKIDGVIHFAALKAVSESIKSPINYYINNISGLLNLINVMTRHGCKNFVFSSSATVYDQKNLVPYTEDMQLGAINPYGFTKLMGEKIISDLAASDSVWKFVSLRYFNPIGAHESGFIGEDPLGIPNNLMPYITQVAIGKREKLKIYGGDWPTGDGTGVRDYLHVVDLAKGHLNAINYLLNGNVSLVANLGTGKGYSVLDLVRSFEAASGKKIPYEIVDRRPGDIAVSYADISLAKKILGWTPIFDLTRMCADSWKWQSMNPNGY